VNRDRYIGILACLLPAWMPIVPADAQGLATERAAVLRSLGTVEASSLKLFPVRDGPGMIFRQPVSVWGANSLRLRLEWENPQPGTASWRILVNSRFETLATITAAHFHEGAFWTDEYSGREVILELHSDLDDEPARIRVTEIAATRDTPERLSITGEYQLQPIGMHAAWIRDSGRSVARIKYIGDDREIYTCTGFLVTRQYLLTNQHCIATDTELRSAIAEFDYLAVFSETVFTRLKALHSSDFALDYSLVELATPADREPLAVSSTPVAEGTRLVIIQHPGGKPLQVSVEDCVVGTPVIAGRGGGETDFAHLGDTETGSCGSPVLARDGREVVGVHHLGFEEGGAVLLNRAVHIAPIVARLRELQFNVNGADDPSGQPTAEE